MKFSQASVALSAALLTKFTSAAPAPQDPYGTWETTPYCPDNHEEEWRNPKEELYDGDLELVTGVSCKTLKNAGCTIAKNYQWSKTTTKTIGMGAIPAFQVSKLLNLAGLPTFSYSWAETKGEATTASIECPKGDGFSCGLAARPRMVKATGEYRLPVEKYGLCEDEPWKPYEVHAVVIKQARSQFNAGEGIQDGADITFSACLEGCDSVESCRQAIAEGLDLCPATDKPEHWDEATKPEEEKPAPPPSEGKNCGYVVSTMQGVTHEAYTLEPTVATFCQCDQTRMAAISTATDEASTSYLVCLDEPQVTISTMPPKPT